MFLMRFDSEAYSCYSQKPKSSTSNSMGDLLSMKAAFRSKSLFQKIAFEFYQTVFYVLFSQNLLLLSVTERPNGS